MAEVMVKQTGRKERVITVTNLDIGRENVGPVRGRKELAATEGNEEEEVAVATQDEVDINNPLHSSSNNSKEDGHRGKGKVGRDKEVINLEITTTPGTIQVSHPIIHGMIRIPLPLL